MYTAEFLYAMDIPKSKNILQNYLQNIIIIQNIISENGTFLYEKVLVKMLFSAYNMITADKEEQHGKRETNGQKEKKQD